MLYEGLAHPIRWLYRTIRRIVVPWVIVVGLPLLVLWALTYAEQECTDLTSPSSGCWLWLETVDLADSIDPFSSATDAPADDAGQADDADVPEPTEDVVHPPGWLNLLLVAAALAGSVWAATRLMAYPHPGPVHLEEVVDARNPAAVPVRRHDLESLITDRLARAGLHPPSTVPTSSGNPRSDPDPGAWSDVPGVMLRMLARLPGRNSHRLGYVLRVVVRHSDRVSQYGMTFVLVSGADGRRVLADTVWSDTAHEAARVVAFRVAAFVSSLDAPPNSGRAPSWSPDHVSLRSHLDATYFMGARRFDEAIVQCEAGLNHDPASLPLRYLLGTLHERLGFFLSALDAYIDALNSMLYKGAGFSRPDKWSAVDDGTRRRTMRRGRWMARRVVSDVGTQILWRYTVCLTFGERWILRWLDDLRRSEGDMPRAAPLGYGADSVSVFAGPATDGGTPSGRPFDDLRDNEIEYRSELAKRLRGFFHMRYTLLLGESFPILNSCVFGERRHETFDAGEATGGPRQPPPVIDDMVLDIYRWRPPRKRRMVHDERTVRAWLVWLLDVAIQAERDMPIAGGRWHDRLMRWRGAAPAGDVPAWRNAADPLSMLARTDAQGGVVNAPRGNRCAARELRQLRRALLAPPGREPTPFSRQRLALFAYSVSIDLLRASDDHALRRAGIEYERSAESLSDPADVVDLDSERFHAELGCRRVRDRVAFIAAQLDLELFFLRAATRETQRIVDLRRMRFKELWTRPFLSPRLVRMAKAGFRYQALERIGRLLYGDAVCCLIEPARPHEWRTSHRLSGVPRVARVARDRIRRAGRFAQRLAGREPVRAFQLVFVDERTYCQRERPWWALSNTMERLRGWVSGEGDWNFWYYRACVLAMTILPRPEHATRRAVVRDRREGGVASRPGRVRPGGSATPERQWTWDSDSAARLAIEALNHSVTRRGSRGMTAIEAGVGDWMLFEDPDLDRLRGHPRFRRWAEGMFELTEPVQRLRTLEGRSKGRASSRRRAGRDSLARLANETFARDLLVRCADRAATSWLAREMVSPPELWALLQKDLAAWKHLIAGPRLVGRAQLRVETWQLIDDLTGDGGAPYPGFPTTTDASDRSRELPVGAFHAHVASAIRECSRDLEEVEDVMRETTTSARDRRAAALCHDAATRAGRRWWRMLVVLGEADVATPPVRAIDSR